MLTVRRSRSGSGRSLACRGGSGAEVPRGGCACRRVRLRRCCRPSRLATFCRSSRERGRRAVCCRRPCSRMRRRWRACTTSGRRGLGRQRARLLQSMGGCLGCGLVGCAASVRQTLPGRLPWRGSHAVQLHGSRNQRPMICKITAAASAAPGVCCRSRNSTLGRLAAASALCRCSPAMVSTGPKGRPGCSRYWAASAVTAAGVNMLRATALRGTFRLTMPLPVMPVVRFYRRNFLLLSG